MPNRQLLDSICLRILRTGAMGVYVARMDATYTLIGERTAWAAGSIGFCMPNMAVRFDITYAG